MDTVSLSRLPVLSLDTSPTLTTPTLTSPTRIAPTGVASSPSRTPFSTSRYPQCAPSALPTAMSAPAPCLGSSLPTVPRKMPLLCAAGLMEGMHSGEEVAIDLIRREIRAAGDSVV